MTTYIKPYTYIAIHKVSGYFYYGVRLSNKVPATRDLGVLYFTSSKTVKTIVEAEGTDAFIWIIRHEFDDKKRAAYWEYKVIRRMLKHPKILNKAVSPINVPGNWYTNGEINILGKYCPIGFVSGRTYVETPNKQAGYTKQKLRVWWNNGVVSVHTEIAPGPGWVHGRLKADLKNWNGSKLAGRQWWNNSQVHYRGNNPPDGFVLGRVKIKRREKSAPRAAESNAQHAAKMKLKKWWTNGTDAVFADHSPGPHYVRGRKLKKASL